MAAVSQLGFLGLGASDIHGWEQFSTKVLGLMIGDRGNDQALYLRMDEYSYRIVVHPDSRDDILYVGWEVADAATLRQIADQVKWPASPSVGIESPASDLLISPGKSGGLMKTE